MADALCLIEPTVELESEYLDMYQDWRRTGEKLVLHIGYGIRPGERRKCYATLILKFALEKAKQIGINKVLVTCDQDNTGSARMIIKNGGKLDSEEMLDGVMIQRYWIDLAEL